MPRMPLCGGLRMGVERSEPKTPPLVMVNVPPLSSCRPSLPSRAGGGEPLDLALDLRERHLLDVPQHRHGQPAVGADGDAEVDVVVVDDVVAVDAGVDARELLQRQHDRAGEEAHEAQADAVESSRTSPCTWPAGP